MTARRMARGGLVPVLVLVGGMSASAAAEPPPFQREIAAWAKRASFSLDPFRDCRGIEEEHFGSVGSVCWSARREKPPARLDLVLSVHPDEAAAKKRMSRFRELPPKLAGDRAKTYPLRAGFRVGKRVVLVTTETPAAERDVHRAAADLAVAAGGSDLTCGSACLEGAPQTDTLGVDNLGKGSDGAGFGNDAAWAEVAKQYPGGLGLGDLGSAGGAGGKAPRSPPRARTPKIELSGATVGTGVRPEVVQRVLMMNKHRFRRCYEEGLSKKPGLAGRVGVAFEISARGSVSRANSQHTQLDDAEVVECIVKLHYFLDFPPPGKDIKVGYLMTLSPE